MSFDTQSASKTYSDMLIKGEPLGEAAMYYESCVAAMDDDIRDGLHNKLCPCSEQVF